MNVTPRENIVPHTFLWDSYPRMYICPWYGVVPTQNWRVDNGILLSPEDYYCVEARHDIFKILLKNNIIPELPPTTEKYIIMNRKTVDRVVEQFEEQVHNEKARIVAGDLEPDPRLCCKTCGQYFPSRTKLFKHLKNQSGPCFIVLEV